MGVPEYRQQRAYAKGQTRDLDDATLDTLWALFEQIGVFWKNVSVEDAQTMRSRWRVFLCNRIAFDANYAVTYREGAELLREMVAAEGPSAYERLFTAGIDVASPPHCALSRLRLLVSNEFITLQLSLGGFKGFLNDRTQANFPGYFGGALLRGQPAPYQIAKDE